MSFDVRVAENQISLTNAVQFIVDNRGKTAPTEPAGIALIATNCVNNTDLYPQKLNLRFVSQSTYDTWFRAHPRPGDILLTNKGSQNGAVCLVPDPVNFCIAQDMVALRADPQKIYPPYLFAALRSDLVQKRIKALNVDAVIPHLKKTDFDKLFIPLPDTAVQEWVGNLYFDLSSRIELLRETNATLEAIAQALFKSWFVDFDPVHAKQQGRAPEGMDEATAALFPDSFEESELGLVPKGWKAGTLGDIATTVKKQLQISALHSELHYVGLEHIPRKSLCLTAWDNAGGLESAKAAFSKGDILFGKLRPYFHKVVIAPFDGVCSTDILVCQPKKSDYYGVTVMHLFSTQLIAYAERLSNGAKMPRVSWKDLAEYPVCIPSEVLSANFSDSIKPLISRMMANVHQAQTLATLRDTLLPRLISGQLRLPEAEAAANAAL